jgi:hypothetical protein
MGSRGGSAEIRAGSIAANALRHECGGPWRPTCLCSPCPGGAPLSGCLALWVRACVGLDSSRSKSRGSRGRMRYRMRDGQERNSRNHGQISHRVSLVPSWRHGASPSCGGCSELTLPAARARGDQRIPDCARITRVVRAVSDTCYRNSMELPCSPASSGANPMVN